MLIALHFERDIGREINMVTILGSIRTYGSMQIKHLCKPGPDIVWSIMQVIHYFAGPELTTRPQGQSKRAFDSFKTMVEKIDYFTSAKKLNENQYKFTVEGSPLYVLWGLGSIPEEITGEVLVTDIYGEETTIDSSQIKHTESPIFIESIR